jgi:hypothetical protein
VSACPIVALEAEFYLDDPSQRDLCDSGDFFLPKGAPVSQE